MTIDFEMLHALQPPEADPCVTLLMTMTPGVTGPQHDEVMFKGLLKDAARGLGEMGVDDATARRTLAPATRLLSGETKWPGGRFHGVALLLTPDAHQVYQLPLTLPDMAVCGRHFYLKPLLPMLSAPRQVCLLVIDQHHLRLLEIDESDPHACREVPLNLASAVMETDRVTEAHDAGLPAGRSRRHGRGGGGVTGVHNPGNIDQDEPLIRLYRDIDRRLHALLTAKHCPLVLAGIGHEVALYRSINTYAGLVAAAVNGSVARGPAATLATAALVAAAPAMRRAEVNALERFDALKSTAQTAILTDTVVRSAYEGKVQTLFLSRAADPWGTYDPVQQLVLVKPPHTPGSDSLHSMAAEETLAHGGEVFVLDAAKMPEYAATAAILRL